jgi:mannose-1-phosphate guanylyltransferase/phosphomannomutase
MELLAAEDRPMSHLLREIPPTTIVRRKLPCPWEHKGALMRLAAAHGAGKSVQFVDGAKFFEGEDWALLYPSQDEAYFHLVVEAEDRKGAEALADLHADLFAGWSRSL